MAGAVAHDYSRKGVAMIAAALAFYVFLGLFPFMLVVIGVMGYVLRSSQGALEVVREALESGLPGSGLDIREQLESIVAHRAFVGGLGLVVLVWSASGAFAMLQRALRIIWEVGRGVPAPPLARAGARALHARLRAVAFTILAVIFLFASTALTAATPILRHLGSALGPPAAAGVLAFGGELAWRLASAGLPLAISFITFLVLYRIVPAPQLALRDLAVGAALAAAGWEIAKRGFSYYLEHFARFNWVYGSVGAMVVLMVWIYVSAIIALVGAELAWVYAQRRGL